MNRRRESDTKEKEEMLREELHKLLDTMTDQQTEDLIPYLSWILNTSYNS